MQGTENEVVPPKYNFEDMIEQALQVGETAADQRSPNKRRAKTARNEEDDE